MASSHTWEYLDKYLQPPTDTRLAELAPRVDLLRSEV